MLITSLMARSPQARPGGLVEAGSGWSSTTSWVVAVIAVAVLALFAWWTSHASRRRR